MSYIGYTYWLVLCWVGLCWLGFAGLCSGLVWASRSCAGLGYDEGMGGEMGMGMKGAGLGSAGLGWAG